MNFPDRASLHQAIDALKPDSLLFLAEFIEYLRYREQQQLPASESEWSMKLTDLFSPVRETADHAPVSTPVQIMLEGLLSEPPTPSTEEIPEQPYSLRAEIERLGDELDRLATGEHRWIGRDGYGQKTSR